MNLLINILFYSSILFLFIALSFFRQGNKESKKGIEGDKRFIKEKDNRGIFYLIITGILFGSSLFLSLFV